MANYALTVTPKFTPFTYDELVKPIEAYQKVYDDYNEKMATLQEEAAKLEKLANNANDANSYNTYKNYEAELQKQINLLQKQGLQATTRQNFNNLRKQFSSDIVPINEALTKREELAKLQRDVMIKNPSYRFQQSAGDISLDEFIKNPNLTVAGLSGDDLYKISAQKFSAFANELTGSNSVRGALIRQKYGFTKDEVLDAINNPDSSSKNARIINTLVDEMMNENGISSYSQADKDYFRGRLLEGAFAGVGKDQLVADYDAQHRIANKYAIKLLEEKHKHNVNNGYIPLQDGRWVDKQGYVVDPETGVRQTDANGSPIKPKAVDPVQEEKDKKEKEEKDKKNNPVYVAQSEERKKMATEYTVDKMRTSTIYKPVALGFATDSSSDNGAGFWVGKQGETVHKVAIENTASPNNGFSFTEGNEEKYLNYQKEDKGPLYPFGSKHWALGQNNGWDNESWSYFVNSDDDDVVDFNIKDFDSGMDKQTFKDRKMQLVTDEEIASSVPRELVAYLQVLQKQNEDVDFQVLKMESPRGDKKHSKTYEYVIMQADRI